MAGASEHLADASQKVLKQVWAAATQRRRLRLPPRRQQASSTGQRQRSRMRPQLAQTRGPPLARPSPAQITALYEHGLGGAADGKSGAGGLGLLRIAADPVVGLAKEIRKPRKKISVMIVGNHSAGARAAKGLQARLDGGACTPAAASSAPATSPLAGRRACVAVGIPLFPGPRPPGKSSFINWYVGERIVKTGVAIETRCGRRRRGEPRSARGALRTL